MDSIFLIVSIITLTIIIMDVPPKETLALNTPSKKIGINAMVESETAPMKTILLSILDRYSLVGLPGLIPGTKPPCFFILSATSIGLNVMDV